MLEWTYSYIKASPRATSDHPRNTPKALPPPAPSTQPQGKCILGFPEDAQDINHLMIRKLSRQNQFNCDSQIPTKGGAFSIVSVKIHLQFVPFVFVFISAFVFYL